MRRFGAGDDAMLGDGNAGGDGDALRLLLVHGERGGEHAGMRVGKPKDFQHALHGAVLAVGPVERVEDDIGAKLRQHFGDVARHVDARYAIARLLQGVGAFLAGGEADRPLRRPAAEEHRHMFPIGHTHTPPFARIAQCARFRG